MDLLDDEGSQKHRDQQRYEAFMSAVAEIEPLLKEIEHTGYAGDIQEAEQKFPYDGLTYLQTADRYKPVIGFDLSSPTGKGSSAAYRRLNNARRTVFMVLTEKACAQITKEPIADNVATVLPEQSADAQTSQEETAGGEEPEYDDWSPRSLQEREERKWPPVPTTGSLSYFFAEAVRTGEKYIDDKKYRRLIDTAAFCLEDVPADIAENVIYHLPVSGRADPKTWTSSFNRLAAVLWRPPVREHEVELAMGTMLAQAADV